MIRAARTGLLIGMISGVVLGMSLVSCAPSVGVRPLPSETMTAEPTAIQLTRTAQAEAVQRIETALAATPDVEATARKLAKLYVAETVEAMTRAAPTPNVGKSRTVEMAPTNVPSATAPPSPTPLPPTPTPIPPAPTPKPAPVPRGLLAYTVTKTFRKDYRIELINTDGSGHRVLVELASEPSFSPDGRQVIFYSWPG